MSPASDPAEDSAAPLREHAGSGDGRSTWRGGKTTRGPWSGTGRDEEGPATSAPRRLLEHPVAVHSEPPLSRSGALAPTPGRCSTRPCAWSMTAATSSLWPASEVSRRTSPRCPSSRAPLTARGWTRDPGDATAAYMSLAESPGTSPDGASSAWQEEGGDVAVNDQRSGVASLTMLLLLASVACTSGTSQHEASPEASPERDSGFGQYVDVGGYSLWMWCEGTGSPTVLLESGLGTLSDWWREVQLDLSTEGRVCSYDRAGLGASDPRPNNGEPASAGTMAKELRTLLRAAGVSPPYVVVGHSFGGMVARVFADMYRPDVEGVVLVDSSSEEQLHGRWDRWFRSMGGSWTEAETRLDMRETERQLRRRDLGSLPLVVLTAGLLDDPGFDPPDWLRKVRADFQRGLAGLSSDSVHVLALDSHHFIQLDQPDLVIEAIREVVTAAESDEALPPCGSAFSELGGRCLPT